MRQIAKLTVLVCLICASAGCTSSQGDESLPPSFVRVELDKSEPERLLSYYFAGYLTPEAADPFRAGVLQTRDGRIYIDVDSLRRHRPQAADALSDQDGSGVIEWPEFERFIQSTYYRVRSAPPSIEALYEAAGFRRDDSAWMTVELHGVMTTARRAVHVRKSAIREALRSYLENGERIIYPAETIFIGEHLVSGRVEETTVMRKRSDGQWDFFVYGSDGMPAAETSTPPRPLKSPVQCVGCHFGDKLFEPEESFPASARPGPHGPRQIYVDDELRDPEVVRFFDEHRKRSDTVLGLYTTLFVARLRAEQRAGTISAADAALLESINL